MHHSSKPMIAFNPVAVRVCSQRDKHLVRLARFECDGKRQPLQPRRIYIQRDVRRHLHVSVLAQRKCRHLDPRRRERRRCICHTQSCNQLFHLLHPYYTISRGTSAAPNGDAASSRVTKTDARRQTLRTSSELQFCQIGDDALRLHGNGDDLQDKVDDVALVAAFGKPLVRIVDDAGILVGRYLIPLNHPLDRALAVDDVFIGGKRYGFDIVTSQPRKDHQTPTATSVCSRDAPAD